MRLLLSLFIGVVWALSASAATLLPNGEQTFVDANGRPYAAGAVYFYIPNTTTPKTTYKDSGNSVLNTNPVILDGAGRAIIYGNGVYRQILKDISGNTIWDQLTADTSSAQISYAGTSTGTANSIIITGTNFSFVNGQIIGFKASSTNTTATTITIDANAPISILKDTISGPVNLAAGDVTVGNNVELVYDTTLGAFHMIAYPALSQSGGIVSGNLNMNGNSIINLAAPANAGDAVNKAYSDTFLLKSGGTLTGDVNVGNHVLSNLASPPTNNLDAVPKNYVDGRIVSARASMLNCSAPAVTNGYNVASFVRTGTGLYTVNFSTGLAGTGYQVLMTGGTAAGDIPVVFSVGTQNTGSFTIRVYNNSAALTDCINMSFAAFGG